MVEPAPTDNDRLVGAGPALFRRSMVRRALGPILVGLGLSGLTLAVILRPAAAGSAGAQDWPPFVLVAGLLLIGMIADDDGLFATSGHALARVAPSGLALFGGAVVMVGVVTALLNLDTSVAFLTPVLVYAARSRGQGGQSLLYGCLLLSNAGSLFLPGSNLTNLIVLGHLNLTGAQFFSHMWSPALAALVTTALVVGVADHRSLRGRVEDPVTASRPALGLGIGAVAAASVLVVVLHNPAIPVAAIGAGVVAVRLAQGKTNIRRVTGVLGLPVLVGLFGVAVALGSLARTWSGPAQLLSHLDRFGTAVFGALSSVLVNNLPAASLLAARRPEHPFSLLIGLNLGPNLFVTGSLAWILWLRSARTAGADPSIAKASRLGAIAVPLSMGTALGLLALEGLR